MTEPEPVRVARRLRRAVASLEAAYARWVKAKKTARLAPEKRGAELDAWILTLGKARHDMQAADAKLAAWRRENPAPARRK